MPRLQPEVNQYILQIGTQTVTTGNPDKWDEYLTKWLIGVGANSLEDVGCVESYLFGINRRTRTVQDNMDSDTFVRSR